MLKLIDNRLARLRRLTARVLLGPRAGTVTAPRHLVSFLALRGNHAGIRDQGRLRDFLPVLSLLKDSPQYRRREIRPVRRVHLVVDVRDFGTGGHRRMREAVLLIGGLFLTLPDCDLTLTVWGNRTPFPVQSMRGESNWTWLGRVASALINLPVDASASVAALRQRLATSEPAHIVLITGWIDPEFVAQLQAPLGGTCFLVEPVVGWLDRSRVGAIDPILSLLPTANAEDRDRHRLADLERACRSRRIDLIRLSNRLDLLDALESQLTGIRK